ncbi:MAG: class I SAM-dependent methyltransferase [Paracoccaceae bacterium]
MQYIYTPPPKPTLSRWRELYRKNPGLSALRVLEYEAVEKIEITGQVLDYGGGQNATYLKLLTKTDNISSVNIDPDIKPTHLVEPGENLPFEDNSFDHVVCFNTLEHIYDDVQSVEEIYRVLKPGGRAVVTVPFIFRIHGHPDDYSRHTPSWWQETYRRAGFSALEFQPLTWGRYTSAGAILGHRGIFPRFQFHYQHFKDWVYAKIAFRGPLYDGRRGQRACAVASGWAMIVTK